MVSGSSNNAKCLDARPWIIGVNTGTSGDGIDVVVVSFTDEFMIVKGGYHLSLPKPIYEPLQRLLNHKTFSWDDYALVEHGLADLSKQAVGHVLNMLSISIDDCLLIACHGQTLAYSQKNNFTHQMMNPYPLIDEFSLPVVCDFRRWDLAHGGRGAPLIPLFHDYLCRIHSKQNFSFLNIGGIANITVIHANTVLGYDIGPGCCLMDEWFRVHHGRSMDDCGAWAASGEVVDELLVVWLRDDIFDSSAPKALSREYFTSTWLTRDLDAYRAEDVMATLLALTLHQIDRVIAEHQIEDLCCFGGGVYIEPLMRHLKLKLRVHHAEETFGLQSDWMEPALFAYLGWMRYLDRTHEAMGQITGGVRTKLGWVCRP